MDKCSKIAFIIVAPFHGCRIQYHSRKELSQQDVKKGDRFDELTLATNVSDPKTLCYEGTPPLFANINRARVALEKLNAAFSAYATLLQTLAGTKSLSEDELKTLSGNINAVASSAWKLSGEDAVSDPGALVGATFSMAADLYIRNRIRSHLQDAIIGNQPQVEKYATQGVVLVGILRKVLIQSYGTQFTSLHMKWTEAKTTEAKETVLVATLDLNVKYMGAFELLAALEHAYSLLPKANRDLARAVEDGDAALPWLNNFSGVSAELKILNADLVSLMAQK